MPSCNTIRFSVPVLALCLTSFFASRSFATLEIKPATASEILKLVGEPGARATIVNVWASWCAPCRDEMPLLVQFRKDHLTKGVRLILVAANNAGSSEDMKEATAFLKSAGVDFPSYALSEPADRFVKNFDPDWRSATVPATFFFDSAGKKTSFKIGRTTLKELEGGLVPLLGK